MSGRSILITGCSSGIGYEAAIALKARGYRVFATARKQADVEKLSAQGLESVQLDVNDTASIQSALDHILSLTDGHLFAVFNNAGFLQSGSILDLSRDMIRAQFETNVLGAMEVTRLVLPIFYKQGEGRIIQNSSILGIITLPYYGAYNASKFALEAFSLTLRQELADTNIHVSLINPGPIATQLRENAYEQYQQTIARDHSPLHENVYQKMEQAYFKPSELDRKLMQSPSAVIKKLIHALESPRPKIHYYVGYPAIIMATLKKGLPEKIFEWITRQIK